MQTIFTDLMPREIPEIFFLRRESLMSSRVRVSSCISQPHIITCSSKWLVNMEFLVYVRICVINFCGNFSNFTEFTVA